MESEIVYVLSNPAFPELLKIGRTANLSARLACLSQSTAIPYPFRVAFAARVGNAAQVEASIHRALAPHRVSVRREFFRVDVDCVVAIVELVAVEVLKAAASSKPRARDRAPDQGPHACTHSTGISRDAALADLNDRLARAEPYTAQTEMQAAWRRPRSTVSQWLGEWEAAGIIPPRQVIGRSKRVTALPAKTGSE